MRFDTLKENFESLWGNVTEGGRHLWRSAAGALTRFKPGEATNLPPASTVEAYTPGQGWSMLGGDVFEDDQRLVVRVEVPGMDKEDLKLEVLDHALLIHGEKRFAHESTEGRWRVMQCAYGNFRRRIPLPIEVKADEARASYNNGVLRVELPKRSPGYGPAVSVAVE